MELSDAQAAYTAALTAYQSALAARSVGSGDRSVTYHDVEKLRAEVQFWAQQVSILSNSSNARGRYSIASWS